MGFGITYTFIIPHSTSDLPNSRAYFYGTLSSWLTVALFLFGILIGILKGVEKNGD